MRQNTGRRLGFVTAALLALLVAGCGGGGSGDGAVEAPQTDPPTGGTPPPAPAPTVGSAELSWMPPTENTDGSVLSDLAGYEIRYGQSATELSQTINLTNPSLNRYLVEDLEAGTWYFAVASINSQGVRSSLSNVASKTIS